MSERAGKRAKFRWQYSLWHLALVVAVVGLALQWGKSARQQRLTVELIVSRNGSVVYDSGHFVCCREPLNMQMLNAMGQANRRSALRTWFGEDAFASVAEVNFAFCPDLCSVIDRDLRQLAYLPNVRKLNLNQCRNVSDDGLRELSPLPRLEWLDLSRTSISDCGLESQRWFNLRSLNLANTRVSDDGLLGIEGCTKLESLVLYNTAVSDAALNRLASLHNLRHLDLRGTNVTPSRVARFRRMQPGCETLYGTQVSERIEDGDGNRHGKPDTQLNQEV